MLHKSKFGDIRNLQPTFFSKRSKGYLYGYPRVYFSINNSSALYTDRPLGTPSDTYVLQSNIKDAFVDPLLPVNNCYYIETRFGVPVKKLSEVKQKEKNKSDVKTESFYDLLLEESENDPIVNWIVTECPYMIDLIFEDELVEESFKSIKKFKNDTSAKIADKVRSYLSKENIEKNFKNINKKISNRVTKLFPCTKEEKEEIYKHFDVCRKEKVSFSDYDKNFKKLCSLLGISSNDTILEYMFVKEKPSEKTDGKYIIEFRYSSSKKIPFIIPNGSILIHKSPLADLKVLKPTFKSKTSGMYLYGSPRVYFALGKMMDDRKMATEKQTTYTYTPTESIKKAYIDPAIKSDKSTGSAIYIDTRFPIRVKRLD